MAKYRNREVEAALEGLNFCDFEMVCAVGLRPTEG
jgi:hypothetical protein